MSPVIHLSPHQSYFNFQLASMRITCGNSFITCGDQTAGSAMLFAVSTLKSM